MPTPEPTPTNYMATMPTPPPTPSPNSLTLKSGAGDSSNLPAGSIAGVAIGSAAIITVCAFLAIRGFSAGPSDKAKNAALKSPFALFMDTHGGVSPGPNSNPNPNACANPNPASKRVKASPAHKSNLHPTSTPTPTPTQYLAPYPHYGCEEKDVELTLTLTDTPPHEAYQDHPPAIPTNTYAPYEPRTSEFNVFDVYYTGTKSTSNPNAHPDPNPSHNPQRKSSFVPYISGGTSTLPTPTPAPNPYPGTASTSPKGVVAFSRRSWLRSTPAQGANPTPNPLMAQGRRRTLNPNPNPNPLSSHHAPHGYG